MPLAWFFLSPAKRKSLWRDVRRSTPPSRKRTTPEHLAKGFLFDALIGVDNQSKKNCAHYTLTTSFSSTIFSGCFAPRTNINFLILSVRFLMAPAKHERKLRGHKVVPQQHPYLSCTGLHRMSRPSLAKRIHPVNSERAAFGSSTNAANELTNAASHPTHNRPSRAVSRQNGTGSS